MSKIDVSALKASSSIQPQRFASALTLTLTFPDKGCASLAQDWRTASILFFPKVNPVLAKIPTLTTLSKTSVFVFRIQSLYKVLASNALP